MRILALIAFTLLVGATLFVAWRAPAATGALGAAAATVFIVFAEWAVRANPDMLVLPGGPMPGVGPVATDGSVTLHLVMAAIFAAGFGIAGFLAQGRSQLGDHSGGVVGGGRRDADRDPRRALRAHRPSRPLDPVRDPRGAARRRLWRCDRSAGAPRRPARALRPPSRCSRPARSARWRWR